MTKGDVFEQLLGQSENQKKSKKTNNYWTLMDFEGKILEMPPEMKDLLEKRDWTTVQSRRVTSMRVKNDQQNEEEKTEMKSVPKEFRNILIVLSHQDISTKAQALFRR